MTFLTGFAERLLFKPLVDILAPAYNTTNKFFLWLSFLFLSAMLCGGLLHGGDFLAPVESAARKNKEYYNTY